MDRTALLTKILAAASIATLAGCGTSTDGNGGAQPAATCVDDPNAEKWPSQGGPDGGPSTLGTGCYTPLAGGAPDLPCVDEPLRAHLIDVTSGGGCTVMGLTARGEVASASAPCGVVCCYESTVSCVTGRPLLAEDGRPRVASIRPRRDWS